MLTKEATIILHSAKVNITDEDNKIIIDKVSSGIDWGKFLYLCIHHRVAPLVYKTFSELNIFNYVEKHIARVIKGECNRIRLHNETIFNEVQIISKSFSEFGIKAILLKGIMLGHSVYKDIALREFGDMDYLVHVDDLSKATEALEKLGYLQGYYDVNKHQITKATKREKMLHRINTHEIIQFNKLIDSNFCSVLEVDVNFDIIWKGNPRLKEIYILDISDIIKNSIQISFGDTKVLSLNPEYQLLQLCTHLYSEAVYFCYDPDWLRDKGDLNLIKFCDIYELIQQEKIDWKYFAEIVHKNKISKPVFYTLYLLSLLFKDTIPQNLLESLNVDPEIIDIYYDESGNTRRWDLGFFDRMFEIDKKVSEINQKGVYTKSSE